MLLESERSFCSFTDIMLHRKKNNSRNRTVPHKTLMEACLKKEILEKTEKHKQLNECGVNLKNIEKLRKNNFSESLLTSYLSYWYLYHIKCIWKCRGSCLCNDHLNYTTSIITQGNNNTWYVFRLNKESRHTITIIIGNINKAHSCDFQLHVSYAYHKMQCKKHSHRNDAFVEIILPIKNKKYFC